MSPNMIAPDGQADWHAVRISPSWIGRPSRSATISAPRMRWTQKVHFSITPRLRTDTSGLRPSLSVSVCQSANVRKLNRRTLYGQLFEQYRVPTHRLYTMSLRPSDECTVAPTGQTTSHGAFSHCTHMRGWKEVPDWSSVHPLSGFGSSWIPP